MIAGNLSYSLYTCFLLKEKKIYGWNLFSQKSLWLFKAGKYRAAHNLLIWLPKYTFSFFPVRYGTCQNKNHSRTKCTSVWYLNKYTTIKPWSVFKWSGTLPNLGSVSLRNCYNILNIISLCKHNSQDLSWRTIPMLINSYPGLVSAAKQTLHYWTTKLRTGLQNGAEKITGEIQVTSGGIRFVVEKWKACPFSQEL